MENTTTILEGYSDREKGAYLCAIASLATADRAAGAEEKEFLEALCQSAGLSAEQQSIVMEAAASALPEEDLKKCLDVLKTSELRFSLISDVIAFANADSSYSDLEKAHVNEMAQYLGVNQEQLSVLDQFTRKAVKEVPQQAQALASGTESYQSQGALGGILDKLGFGDKLKNAGINTNGLLKGALGILGPILLARMFSGRRQASGGGGGMFGGMGGGLLGGLAGMMAGGGLLGGLLGGGRGFGPAAGMLGKIFGGRRGG